MLMDHCVNQALEAVDLYPHSPTKLKKSTKLSTRMTLGFKVRGIFLWCLFLLRLDYSMATPTSGSREDWRGDFTATCRSREEQKKLETIKTPAMDPGYEDVISDFRTFVNGKKFYKRKGKTWKRGYLLYEPPGSDGASLIAAMADFLEFNLYNLDLASFSSFSELKNTLLVGTWSSSVIWMHDPGDFDHCAGMLPNLKNELKGSCLLEFVNGLLSSCGDEQIIVFTTNNRDRHDAARRRHLNEDIYVHKSSPQPVALADEGEIVQLNSSRQKPLVDFVATNIKAYQSSLLVSNSEEKNTTEASARRCMTESGHSLGDERPFEVMNLSADGKLVSRLQRIHISWLGSFAPQPSALPGGGESVGPIALSSSEFASTNNKAQHFGQDKSGSAASDSKKKRTRKQEDCKEINTSITLDDLRQHYGRKRKDVAESLGVSVSTLKRTCRQYGIKQWPNIIKKKAGRPPDQHGEKILSPTCKTLSTNGQNETENEIVGHLEETNEFLLDFVEGPNGGVSSEWAFELRDQWTVSTSYPNSNGPEVPHPHIASTQILGENMGSLGDRRNSFGSLEEHILQGHISGSMWTVPPCSDPASSQHMPTITPTMGSSEDQISSLAFLEDVFLEEDVSGSISWTIPTCFQPAPSQLMPSVPRTSGSSDDLGNLLPSVEECFPARHVSGFINGTVPSCSYPGPSQPMSIVPHTTGSSDALRNFTYDFAAELSGELCHRDTEQWFFFVPRQEREARGGKPSRTAASGYWKATGSPNYVYSSDNRVIGMKKTMVFYEGKAPSGRKTEWKMNEYKAIDQETSTPFGCAVPKLRHEFSLCRVYLKCGSFRAFDRRPLRAETKRSDTQQLVHDLTESVLSFDDPTRRKLLPDRTSLASLELTSRDFDDFDHCAAMLLDVNDEFGGGLSSSCGDERINISTSNHGDRHDAALLPLVNMDTCIHTSSTQPVALPDGGEIVQLESSKKNPWVDFDATNNRSHQSGVLVSNSENQKMREASKRRCMMESVLSLVDSKTRISSMDYDAPLNRAHLLKAHQSSPIAFNSEKKDTREELHRECLTKTVLSLDDSTKQNALLDFDATEDKAHLFRACQSGLVVSLSENKRRGEALKRECITKNILSLEDLQEHCGDGFDDAANTFGAIYDPGFHMPDSLARKSFEVLETLPTEEQPIDCVPLLTQGRLPLEGCLQQEKSPDLPRVMQINGVEQRVTKMPRYLGGLTDQSASSSRWPTSFPDGGHIVLLDPLDQSTKNIEHVARADQCSPTVFLAEKKMVRKCRTMSVIFEENHLHFGRRCEGAAKSLGAMRICRKHGINLVCMLKRIHKQHGIHQWPFRQKWATMKGYSLGEESPFEVRRLSMDEKLDSRLQLIHMSQFARPSPRALALSDGGIVRPTALSSSEFAATNNRADLVGQDQSSSAASHYRYKNTREMSDKQGLEDLQQHFGCKHKYSLKSLGVSGSMFKSTCRQHWFYWWQGLFQNNEQQAFDATSNRAHLVKADERGPTVSNALFLEDLQHQFGARCKDAAKGLHDALAWKSFNVQDNLPLGEQFNTRRRSLTHKHCVRLKKSQDLPRSMLRDCAGGLAAQSDIDLPDGGHILSLSEKKIVRKTLKGKCRTMSVLSLEDHQQHVRRRWEDTVKFLGAKRICRQLVIHCETTAKGIRRQLGTHRWLFKQSAINLPDGGHILSLSEKKIVRKTLKRKCRSMSVLSLEDHKQHVDRRWEGAVKSHGAKRICRQLVIHRSSTAKHIHKEHGIHRWPFQRSFIGLPDGGHILPLSEKKILRKTLKRKCRGMSVLSLVDRQQHVDRRWEDAAKNIGVKLICGQLVIHRVSIAKRIYRRHGIYHLWPFQQDWATIKGYSLGDEIPVEVISLSTHAKLVPRLQLIYISWLGRFSPRPSALAGGGEIGGPIALSLSESAATKNIAQHVGQDQSGSAASDSENERTREQEDLKEIHASITKDDLRRLYGRKNRKDAAASLGVSESTFKRKCREYEIKRWPHVRKRKVGRPPDQHGEGNTSTTRETPSIYVQTGMEGELVGQNVQRDFMGCPNALNTESGLIMVSRPPDQHGERNTSTTCGTPSRNVEIGMEVEPVGQNQEANVFQRDFMNGPIALNTDGLTFPECSDAVAPSQPMATILDAIPHLNGGFSECAFQVKNQSTQFTANPYPNGLVDPHPQIALTQILSEDMERLEDRRNLLAPRKEPLLEGHVFGSANWTVRSCSDVALSQPMPTIPDTTGCSEYWRNSLALLEGHLLEENYESINLTAPSCFDPGPSQPMHTIPHTMPTIPQMMPLLTERQDMSFVRLKATYGNTTIKFPLPSGFSELKEEVSKRLEFERGSFKLEYKDEEGDSVLIGCDEDVRDYLRLLTSLGNQVIKLFVLDKVPNTTNFCDNCGCDNCRSLKCKRP